MAVALEAQALYMVDAAIVCKRSSGPGLTGSANGESEQGSSTLLPTWLEATQDA
jgi:hypothetical protein